MYALKSMNDAIWRHLDMIWSTPILVHLHMPLVKQAVNSRPASWPQTLQDLDHLLQTDPGVHSVKWRGDFIDMIYEYHDNEDGWSCLAIYIYMIYIYIYLLYIIYYAYLVSSGGKQLGGVVALGIMVTAHDCQRWWSRRGDGPVTLSGFRMNMDELPSGYD